MMSNSANLSVGLDTASAKASLLELKQMLTTAFTNISLNIDPNSVEKQIESGLKSKKFKFDVSQNAFKTIRTEIEGAVSEGIDVAFSKPGRELKWNRDRFYGSLKSAVDGVFTQRRTLDYNQEVLRLRLRGDIDSVLNQKNLLNVTINGTQVAQQLQAAVGAVQVQGAQPAQAAAAKLDNADMAVLATKMLASLTPAVDALEKAALVLAGNARAQGLSTPTSTPGGSRRGSRRRSARSPETGETISFTETVDPDRALEAINRQTIIDRREKAIRDLEKSVVAGQKEFAALRSEQTRQKVDPRSSPDAAWAFIEAQRQKSATPSADEAFESRKRQLQAEGQSRIDADYQKALKEQINQRLQTERQGISAAERWFRALGEVEREVEAKAKQMAKDNAKSIARSVSQIRGDSAYEGLSERIRAGAFNTMEARDKKASRARAAVFDQIEKSDLQSRLALEKQFDEMQKSREQARKAQNKEAAREIAENLALQARAKAAADEVNKSAMQAQSRKQSDLKKNLAFAAPGAVDELKRLESQLRKVREAQFLINNGDSQLALKTYGSAAVQAASDLSTLESRVNTLRTSLAAAGRVNARTPEQERKEQLGAIYNAAKFQARERYSGDGVKIAAAQALANADGVGRDAARSFLGRDGFLLDQANQLQRYTKEINNASLAKTGMRTLVNEIHSGVRGLTGSLGLLWLTWGSTIPLAAGAAIGASMRSVVSVGKEVEYQLKFVQVLSGGTAVALEELNLAISGTAAAPREAVNALRGLAQNGLTATEALAALPDVLRLATVGEMDFMDAALGVTGVMSAFDLGVNKIARVGDVFAMAAASSNTSVASMVESMRQASTVGDKYKVSLEETAAALAVMAKRNITGSAAGTAFRNMMVELATPTDKAKTAMKMLGLEIFDSNNQIKPLLQILDELKQKTDGLNDKSRLAFLNEMFNERGAKAANAILSDFKEFSEFRNKFVNEASGFSRTVSDQLAETTQVKLKRLLSEFQQVTAQTFFESSDSVKNFVDELRAAVKSDDFKQALQGIFDFTVGIGRYVTENAKSIGALVLALAGLNATVTLLRTSLVALTAATPLMAALSPGIAAAATSASAFLRAFAPLAGLMFGGVGIVVALAAQYLLLSRNISKAEEAARTHLNTIREQTKAAQDEATRVGKRNSLLVQEIELMYRGVDAVKARQKAESELAKSSIAQERNKVVAEKSEAVIGKAKLLSDVRAGKGPIGYSDKLEEYESIIRLADERLSALNERSAAIQDADARQALNNLLDDRKKVIAGIIEFNEEVDRLTKAKMLSKPVEKISLKAFEAARAPTKRMQDALRDSQTELNNAKRNLDLPDPKAGVQENKDALAEIAEMQAGYKRDLQAADAYYKAQEALLRASQQAKLITQEEFEVRSTQLAEEQMQFRVGLARTELSQIQLFKEKNKDLKPEQKTRVDTWISDASAEVERLRIEIDSSVAQAAIKTQGALNEVAEGGYQARLKAILDVVRILKDLDAEASRTQLSLSGALGPAASESLYPSLFVSSSGSMSREASEALRQEREAARRQSFQNRQLRKAETITGSDGARDRSVEAAMKAFDAFEPAREKAILEAEQIQRQLSKLEGRRLALEQSLQSALSINQAQQISAEIKSMEESAGKLRTRLEVARGNVVAIEAQQAASSELAAEKARQVVERQRSAEYGMLGFWRSYQQQAADTASVVSNVMSQSFQAMETGLMRFVTTGKLNFKDLMRSMVADAARMLANAAIKKLLAMGLDFAMSGFGSSSGSNVNSAVDMSAKNYFTSANGNVMTDFGPLPLRQFANGGVARRPMVSVFGEGMRPEAYVPLPDGRSIPVTMRVAGEGSGGVNVSISVTMNGTQQTDRTESQQNTGTQLARQLEQAVRQVLVNEKRVGGLLEKA